MKKLNRTCSVILCIALVSSYALFYFQDMVARYVKSSDICNAYVYDILKWIIPKIIFRCNLLNETGMRDHPGIDIMIVLDIWIAICCTMSLMYVIWRLMIDPRIITREDMLQYFVSLRGMKGRVESAKYFFSGIVVFFLLIVFVYSPGIHDGGGGFEALLALTSGHGFGVIFHVVVAVTCSYSLLMAILSSRILRALAIGDIR